MYVLTLFNIQGNFISKMIGVWIFWIRLHCYSEKFDSCSWSCYGKNAEFQLLFDSCWKSAKNHKNHCYIKGMKHKLNSGSGTCSGFLANFLLQFRLHSWFGCWSPLLHLHYLRPYSESKLELNSKKSNSSDTKNFCLCLYLSFMR